MVLMMRKTDEPNKAERLLAQHRLEIIESLDGRAFDLLTPKEVATELGLENSKRLPDLIREKWLEGAPGKDIGTAHQYYRWRVEFVKRYRRWYKKHE